MRLGKSSICMIWAVLLLTWLWGSEALDCALACNDLRYEVLILSICRDAKRTLPKPKVGDVCSLAMEQGFTDACVGLCEGFPKPQSRLSQACRAAAMEMPRPTVRKWCEHGYTKAFDKAMNDLRTHFVVNNEEALFTEGEEELTIEPEAETDVPADIGMTEIHLKVPITLGDETMELVVYKGQAAEDAVASFCRQHLPESLSDCVRQLLPDINERLTQTLTEG